MFNLIRPIIDNSSQVDAVYIDIVNTFDRISNLDILSRQLTDFLIVLFSFCSLTLLVALKR